MIFFPETPNVILCQSRAGNLDAGGGGSGGGCSGGGGGSLGGHGFGRGYLEPCTLDATLGDTCVSTRSGILSGASLQIVSQNHQHIKQITITTSMAFSQHLDVAADCNIPYDVASEGQRR